MILTVDIGNSRIKWALWQADVIVTRGQTDYAAVYDATTFDTLFQGVAQPSAVYAICVAADVAAQALNSWVLRHWQTDVAYLKTEKKYKKLLHAYNEPAQHGVDRWAALVAAYQSFPDTAICVINAGTATTFDLIDNSGQHLGGYILPSFYTMHKALLADTANVASKFSEQLQQKIPTNTSDAVNQGLHKFMQSGIREMCQFAQDTMGKPVQLVLTGGFAQAILYYPEMPAMCFKPDLVMQGLYDVMQQRQSENISSEAAPMEK
jgi:type III pantothenate kinase